MLAIFGLLVFQQSVFGFLSFTAEGNAVFGRSFFTAGAMMALIALPLIVGATREALQAIPAPRPRGLLRARQGQDLDDPARPAARLAPRHRHRHHARHGPDRRRHGDRRRPARRLAADPAGERHPGLGLLKGTGSTLTTYVYNNSPAGEGGAPQKAYAAAFVLLVIVILLNFAVDLDRARKGARHGPGDARPRPELPPAGEADRVEGEPTIVEAPANGNGHVVAAAAALPKRMPRAETTTPSSGCGPRD